MKRTIAAALAAVALAGLTGCGSSGGNAAACETAMRAQIVPGMSGVAGSKPSQCDGLSDAQLAALGTKVVGAAFTQAASGDVTACEAALRKQVETVGQITEDTPASCVGLTSTDLDPISARIVADAKSGKLTVGGGR